MTIADKSNTQRANRSGSDGHTRSIRGGSSLRRSTFRASALLAFALVVPAAAQAGIITQTASYGPQATDWKGIPLSFAGFNSSLGSLQSVALSVTESFTGTAQGTNTSSTTSTTSFLIRNTGVVVNSVANPNIVDISVPDSQSTNSVTLAPGATSPLFSLSGSNTKSQTYTSNFAFFGNPYTLTASDTAFEGLSGGGGNLTASFTDTGKVGVAATYTYGANPVPAPGSLALFGAGLLGLGWFASRRRHRRSQS